MTEEYRPPALQHILESPLANKRLKRRDGYLFCISCDATWEGLILELYESGKSDHEGHDWILSEGACRHGLM